MTQIETQTQIGAQTPITHWSTPTSRWKEKQQGSALVKMTWLLVGTVGVGFLIGLATNPKGMIDAMANAAGIHPGEPVTAQQMAPNQSTSDASLACLPSAGSQLIQVGAENAAGTKCDGTKSFADGGSLGNLTLNDGRTFETIQDGDHKLVAKSFSPFTEDAQGVILPNGQRFNWATPDSTPTNPSIGGNGNGKGNGGGTVTRPSETPTDNSATAFLVGGGIVFLAAQANELFRRFERWVFPIPFKIVGGVLRGIGKFIGKVGHHMLVPRNNVTHL